MLEKTSKKKNTTKISSGQVEEKVLDQTGEGLAILLSLMVTPGYAVHKYHLQAKHEL